MKILDLPAVLNWTAAADIAGQSYGEYQKRMMLTWGAALMRIMRADLQIGRSLAVKARSLPQDSFQRFLTAPEVTCRLNGFANQDSTGSTAKFFGDALDAEYCRLGAKGECVQAVWSALGDWYFPEADLNGSWNAQHDNLRSVQWKAESVFSAPRTANGLPVDFCGPLARSQSLEKWYGSYSGFADAEIRLVMERLDEALCGTAESSVQTEKFIRVFTRVIVLKKNTNEPSQIISRSLSQYIGATLLENPQNDETDSTSLAEGLVHEAIHHLLYALELQQPLVSDHEAARDWRIPTPWSGNKLRLRQYLHACLVWFGLWSFWRLCVDSRVFAGNKVKQRIAEIGAGFRGAPLLGSLAQLPSIVPADLQTIIGRIQEIVVRESSAV